MLYRKSYVVCRMSHAGAARNACYVLGDGYVYFKENNKRSKVWTDERNFTRSLSIVHVRFGR